MEFIYLKNEDFDMLKNCTFINFIRLDECIEIAIINKYIKNGSEYVDLIDYIDIIFKTEKLYLNSNNRNNSYIKSCYYTINYNSNTYFTISIKIIFKKNTILDLINGEYIIQNKKQHMKFAYFHIYSKRLINKNFYVLPIDKYEYELYEDINDCLKFIFPYSIFIQ